MGDRRSAIDFHNKAIETVNDKTLPANAQLSYQLWGSSAIVDTTFAEGWYRLGNASGDLKLMKSAIASYRRMMECPMGDGPGDLTPALKAKGLINLGHRLYNVGQIREGYEVTLRGLELDDTLANGWLNLALCEAATFRMGSAIEKAEKAFALDPSPMIESGLALLLLFDRQFARGLKHFEARFAYKLQNFLQYPYPKWRGEEGATVLLVADQGLGDTLSYARFVRRAAERAKFIHATVQAELLRVFRASFADLANVNFIPNPAPFQPADYWTTFVSLPFALGLSDEEIIEAPGIHLPPFSAPGGWRSADAKLHVGVAWAGSPLSDIDEHRSFPIELLLELYRVPGIQLYSLQVGDKVSELHARGCGALIRDLSPYIRDVGDTMAILGDLDLVITVESALGHIAGAVGKETWIPYSFLGRDYRLGPRGEEPLWYPNHQVFQQGPQMNWDPVFEDITEALRERAGWRTANTGELLKPGQRAEYRWNDDSRDIAAGS